MVVPRVGPIRNVVIKWLEKKILKKPNVARQFGVEVCFAFQVLEEKFPLGSNALREIKPETLDPNIVNTSAYL